jgi:hypothetical protein
MEPGGGVLCFYECTYVPVYPVQHAWIAMHGAQVDSRTNLEVMLGRSEFFHTAGSATAVICKESD